MKRIPYYILFLACWLSVGVYGQDGQNGQNQQSILFRLSEKYDIDSILSTQKQHMKARKSVVDNAAKRAMKTGSRQDSLQRFQKLVNTLIANRQRAATQLVSGNKTGKSMAKSSVVTKNSMTTGSPMMTMNSGNSRFVVEVGSYSDEIQFIHTQDTRLTTDAYRPSDWSWADSPNDVFYRFTLEKPVDLIITAEPYRVYLLEEEVGTGHLIPVTPTDIVADVYYYFAQLKGGTYHVVSEGATGNSGTVFNGEITTTIYAMPLTYEPEEPDKPEIENLGVLSNDTSLTVTGDTGDGLNEYGNSYNDLIYRFELSSYADFSASLSSPGLSSVNMYLLDEEKNIIASSQDFALEVNSLPAGMYYLVAEGVEENGLISITVAAASPGKLMIDLGSHSDLFTAGHDLDTRLTPDGYRPPGWPWAGSPNDVFYRFTLETPMAVLAGITPESGSVYYLEEDPDTGLLIPVESLFDPFWKWHVAMLRKGTHYVVFEASIDSNGVASNGEITTGIAGLPNRFEVPLGAFADTVSLSVTGDTRRTSSEHGDLSRDDIYYSFDLQVP